METLFDDEQSDAIDYDSWVRELEIDIAETRRLRDQTQSRLEKILEEDRLGQDTMTYSLRVSCESFLRLCDECLAYFIEERARYRDYIS